jgi:hypothetical protein
MLMSVILLLFLAVSSFATWLTWHKGFKKLSLVNAFCVGVDFYMCLVWMGAG